MERQGCQNLTYPCDAAGFHFEGLLLRHRYSQYNASLIMRALSTNRLGFEYLLGKNRKDLLNIVRAQLPNHGVVQIPYTKILCSMIESNQGYSEMCRCVFPGLRRPDTFPKNARGSKPQHFHLTRPHPPFVLQRQCLDLSYYYPTAHL